MDSILIVLIIYELHWDDVDEDGEGWRGYRTPKIFQTLFLKISRN
jgi:hypothetical protein